MTITLTSIPRWRVFLCFATVLIPLFYLTVSRLEIELFTGESNGPTRNPSPPENLIQGFDLRPSIGDDKFHWANVPQKYPVTSMKAVPSSKPGSIPRIQHVFKKESAKSRDLRLERLQSVKGNFTHAWKGYKDHAWLKDEVGPISGNALNPFGGWAATLVDSLDTLWIMGLHADFEVAVDAVKEIDFSSCTLTEINLFETTIRYLGGLLGAYDISKGKYPQLLVKATEVGDMLYKAFDTPNRMPIARWKFRDAISGVSQEASDNVLVSEIGSLSLEFTRLSQATGDPKFYDAVQRIMDVFEDQQSKTKLPGMWPIVVNAKTKDFTEHGGFTIGGMADSLYEYLPKQHILLGGATEQYRNLYLNSMISIKQHIFYRPMTQNGEDVRLAGNLNVDGKTPLSKLKTDPEAQHLGCFAGGMVAIGSRIFQDDEDLLLARKLVGGCLWAYEVMPLGVMPEIMHTIACANKDDCPWDEKRWHAEITSRHDGEEDVETKIKQHLLRPGVTKVDDRRYILRPESIESVFILYRITGDTTLQERAWNMFNAIIENTVTDIAHAALDDCTVPNPRKTDRMESFWLAETLKYFYLVFSEPDIVSLDEYVLNTEAHSLRRPL